MEHYNFEFFEQTGFGRNAGGIEVAVPYEAPQRTYNHNEMFRII
jgi:hypothetical protein